MGGAGGRTGREGKHLSLGLLSASQYCCLNPDCSERGEGGLLSGQRGSHTSLVPEEIFWGPRYSEPVPSWEKLPLI